MSETIKVSSELTVVTCWCGMIHAVPADLYDYQQRAHRDGQNVKSIYCPLGHTWLPAGEGEAAKLQRRLAREVSSHDQTRAELEGQRRKTAAAKGAKTRLENRVRAGFCPCCKRHFKNVRAHITKQHPDFAEETRKL